MVRENKKFIYKVDLKWSNARKGVVSSSGKPTIEVATPPEFKGHPGFWTPEDLYVASVNACFMSTFLYYAEKRQLSFSAFSASAEGILEQVDKEFIISTVNITAYLVIAVGESVEKAKATLELAEKDCLVSNSIKSKINLTSQIEINNKQ
jgi:organic hydroperoxide reductase OsmC/OhrA